MAKNPLKNRVLFRLISFLKPHKFMFMGGVFFMLTGSLATAAIVRVIRPIIDRVFIEQNQEKLYIVAFQIMLIFLVKAISYYGETVMMGVAGERVIADVQKKLFKKLTFLDLNFFKKFSAGELVSRFISDVRLLEHAITNTITTFVRDLFTFVFLVGLMFYQDPLLASIVLFVFPIAISPIAKISAMIKKASHNSQAETARFSNFILQSFQGARLIKAYCMEKIEIEKANSSINDLYKTMVKALKSKSITNPIMEIIGGIAFVAIVLYGGSQVIAGKLTAGSFFSFIMAIILAYEPMRRLAKLNSNLQESLAASERIFKILDLESSIKEKDNAKDLIVKNAHISFKGVNFSYDKGEKKDENNHILNNIDIEIPGGKTVALVGTSGSGKTTIMNLIPRFFDVDSGVITIDGTDISEVKIKSLRQNIAMVSQDVVLFNDTVASNIKFAKPDATMEEVIKAAKQADAHAFIEQLPYGYDYNVGDGGNLLSGGQKQRIAIARAFLKDAPILLLDEATSALDSESETKIQETLNKLSKGRTTLVIAHRLSTIMHADIIYIVENGCITNSGNHEQLLQSSATYKKLYQNQFKDINQKIA